MKTAYTSDRIKKDDARKLLVMKLQLEAQVLEKHRYAIAQGAGADRRWFTNVYENGPDGKRHKKKMAAASYDEGAWRAGGGRALHGSHRARERGGH